MCWAKACILSLICRKRGVWVLSYSTFVVEETQTKGHNTLLCLLKFLHVGDIRSSPVGRGRWGLENLVKGQSAWSTETRWKGEPAPRGCPLACSDNCMCVHSSQCHRQWHWECDCSLGVLEIKNRCQSRCPPPMSPQESWSLLPGSG